MNNAVLEKTMENVANYGEFKRVTTGAKNHLVSEPEYQTTKFFSRNFISQRNGKKDVHE